jgi:hypothetical protein
MTRTLLALLALTATACSNTASDDGPVGEAQLQITQVPPMVGCVQITVAGSRTVTRNFDVTPGNSSVLRMDALPVGNDLFTGSAFSSACSSVSTSSVPNWLSATTAATVTAGGLVSVALELVPNGSASVSVDFQADMATSPPPTCDPATCPPTANGTAICITTTNTCGFVCNTGFVACGAKCIPSTGCCTNADCGGERCVNNNCVPVTCTPPLHDCGDGICTKALCM